jgi:hypothetical protein
MRVIYLGVVQALTFSAEQWSGLSNPGALNYAEA